MAYIANSDADRQEMLQKIGVSSFEELLQDIPDEVRFKGALNLPEAVSEYEAAAIIENLAAKNKRGILFLGGGAYDHYIPAAVRHILWRSEFYTAYTPYQPEVSQGTLQAIYEYQTLICRLTGMEVANASMYDGGSALAEAVLMAAHHTGKSGILVPENLHPHYYHIIETYIYHQDIQLIPIPVQDGAIDKEALFDLIDQNTAAVILQNPNFYGIIEDTDGIAERLHDVNALFIVFVDPISLGILKPPGEYGADIVIGEGQALGNPLNFGGPYLGIFAARKDLIRKMPGRIVAMTNDLDGKRAFVTTLQTREQHIRREKATSNICTNSQLCALATTVYLSLLGKSGLQKVARTCAINSHYLAEKISEIPGFSLKYSQPFFKEFVVETPVPPAEIIIALASQGIFAGLDLAKFGKEDGLLVAVTEKRTRAEMDQYISIFKKL